MKLFDIEPLNKHEPEIRVAFSLLVDERMYSFDKV